MDREKVIKALECCITKYHHYERDCDSCPYYKMSGDNRIDCCDAMMIDAAELLKEQTQGHWIRMTGMMPPEYIGHYECSECGWHGGRYQPVETKFSVCPNCGARMTGVQMHG